MSSFGNRPDSTPKGLGYFGQLRRPGGGVSTELSFDFDAGGQNILAPLLVPTLSRAEIDQLLSGAKPSDAIYRKAQDFALGRLKLNKPVWALPGEIYPLPPSSPPAIPMSMEEILRGR